MNRLLLVMSMIIAQLIFSTTWAQEENPDDVSHLSPAAQALANKRRQSSEDIVKEALKLVKNSVMNNCHALTEKEAALDGETIATSRRTNPQDDADQKVIDAAKIKVANATKDMKKLATQFVSDMVNVSAYVEVMEYWKTNNGRTCAGGVSCSDEFETKLKDFYKQTPVNNDKRLGKGWIPANPIEEQISDLCKIKKQADHSDVDANPSNWFADSVMSNVNHYTYDFGTETNNSSTFRQFRDSLKDQIKILPGFTNDKSKDQLKYKSVT